MSSIAPMPRVPAGIADWAPPPRSIYRLSVDQYEAMIASGVFAKRDRLQLIHGVLVARMTEHSPHAVASTKLWSGLLRAVPAGWHLRVEKPLRIPGRASVPEPDVALARGEPDDYLANHPGPADVAMVAEVSDSSLDDDRGLMCSLYGAGGVPIYWVVNLVDRQVEVYSGPRPDGYGRCSVYRRGDTVPIVVDGAEVGRVAVADVLPKGLA